MRQPFDASLDPVATYVEVSRPDALCVWEQERTRHVFNRFGFVVLRPRHSPLEGFLRLASELGCTSPHARADSVGITHIHAFETPVPGFIDTTDRAYPLHTDGAFLRAPERLTLLRCGTPARKGGETLVASGLAAHLALDRPGELEALEAPDAVTIRRLHQAHTGPVFTGRGKSRGIRFRADTTATTIPSLRATGALRRLQGFLSKPRSRVQLSLEPGDIFIADNTGVLHGRKAFFHDRRFQRMNTDGTGPFGRTLHYGF
jgi:alpha-ketoglutarate-dependent taurine dioxygenase